MIQSHFYNILYVKHNTKKISVAYRSKHSNKRKKQVTLLVIGDDEKYHYVVVTNLSALLQKISLNHKEDFYCLNRFSSYTTKINLKNMKKYVIIIIVVV